MLYCLNATGFLRTFPAQRRDRMWGWQRDRKNGREWKKKNQKDFAQQSRLSNGVPS